MELVIDNINLQSSPKKTEVFTKFKEYVEARFIGFFS